MHVTVFHFNMDRCIEPGNFPDWTKILTSAGDMVQNVFNNDEWELLANVQNYGTRKEMVSWSNLKNYAHVQELGWCQLLRVGTNGYR